MSGRAETPKEAARRLAAPAIAQGYVPQALHEYANVEGRPVFWRIRAKHPKTGEKWIRPMHSNGMGFALGEPDFSPAGKILYRLDALIRADKSRPVFFVEGEQKVDAIAKRGLLATTGGSASSDETADFEPLRGRRVILWPDNDTPGREHMQRVARKLVAIECTVERIDTGVLTLREHGDVCDFLADHPHATGADLMALARLPNGGEPVQLRAAHAWLDPTPLPADLEPVEPFPLEAMPDSVRPWCADVADRMQCPLDFVAVPLLIGLASLAARKVAIRPQMNTDWTEHANLWALIVGRPGRGEQFLALRCHRAIPFPLNDCPRAASLAASQTRGCTARLVRL